MGARQECQPLLRPCGALCAAAPVPTPSPALWGKPSAAGALLTLKDNHLSFEKRGRSQQQAGAGVNALPNNNNNNNNNHFTRTLSVLTSARVFMRRQAIPPLCGGAVQALPNIQTTLRDHPHPASRPMTFGHFTSWHADDRGYYTGAWVRRRRRRGWIFRFFG